MIDYLKLTSASVGRSRFIMYFFCLDRCQLLDSASTNAVKSTGKPSSIWRVSATDPEPSHWPGIFARPQAGDKAATLGLSVHATDARKVTVAAQLITGALVRAATSTGFKT